MLKIPKTNENDNHKEEGKLISIDGKTLRHSFDNKNDKAAIHMVSPWMAIDNILCSNFY